MKMHVKMVIIEVDFPKQNSNDCHELRCNTSGTTKAQDNTNVPSLMPEYKTWRQKPIIKVNAEATTRTKL
jgi:hypothetical protein